jgi:hypothetical protein
MVIWNQLATLSNVALFSFLKEFGAVKVAELLEAKLNKTLYFSLLAGKRAVFTAILF